MAYNFINLRVRDFSLQIYVHFIQIQTVINVQCTLKHTQACPRAQKTHTYAFSYIRSATSKSFIGKKWSIHLLNWKGKNRFLFAMVNMLGKLPLKLVMQQEVLNACNVTQRTPLRNTLTYGISSSDSVMRNWILGSFLAHIEWNISPLNVYTLIKMSMDQTSEA